MKILVVDDDESQRRLVSRLLTRESHEVVLKDTLMGGLAELIPESGLGG